ncbi:MAG TPA: ADOP family duplicated permease [Longimicrobium sp.]|jgi:predicted permease
MGFLHGMRVRVRANLRRRQAEAELDDEFQFHLEMETERLAAEGLTSAEARRQARINFGGVTQHKETMRAERGIPLLESLWRDVRLAARGMRRNPGLAAGAVLSLGLAIGLNTAMFSFVNVLLYKPLPVPGGERMVEVALVKRGPPRPGPGPSVSYPDYLEYRGRTRTLQGLAVRRVAETAVRTAGGEPASRQVQLVSANLFQVLGARPARGRFFLPEEDRTPGTHPVVVVSHHYWRHTLNGDPRVLGRTLLLNRVPFTVVGVAPRGFRGAEVMEAFDLFVPLMMRGALEPGGAPASLGRDGAWGQMIGRLRPGVTPEQAQAELSGMAAALAPGRAADTGVEVRPIRGIRREMQQMIRPYLFAVMGMVVAVLMVAWSNVAGLLLARAEARRREVAIRLSLGAGRRALVRQFLVESGLMAAAGGALGFLLSLWKADTLQLLMGVPPSVRVELDFSPDWRVLAFASAASLGCALIFGLLPALQATRPEIARSLRGELSGRRRSLAGGAVVVQVAFAAVLLFGTGILVRGLVGTLWADTGMRTRGVIAASVRPAAYESTAGGEAFHDALARRLRARPGVEAVALASSPVLDCCPAQALVVIPGEDPARLADERRIAYNAVTPGMLEMLDVPLRRGRSIQATDTKGAPLVAVVSEATARRLWPGGRALGERFRIEDREFEVVGVAADARYVVSAEERPPYLLLSYAQNAETGLVWQTVVLARAREGAAHELPAIVRREAHALDREALVTSRTLDGTLYDALRAERVFGALLGVCAALALLLAAVGTYSLLAYMVARRTREIGVRLALGARAGDLRRLVVRRGVRLVALGAMMGVPLGVVAWRPLQPMFQRAAPADPLFYLAIALVLAAVAAAGSWIPAWRATRVDPMVALRLD